MYSPHTSYSMSNFTVQDNFSNKLGYLNVPVSSLAVLPPVDMVRYTIRLLRLPWGGQDMIFQPGRSIPPQFTGWWTFGVTHMPISPDSVNINLYPKQMDAVRQSHVHTYNKRIFVQENTDISHVELSFYLSKRFVSQNSLRQGSSLIRYDLTSPFIKEVLPIYGILALLEYSGSLRYNLTTDSFMVFVKGGYDLSSYSFARVPSYGELLSDPDRFLDSPNPDDFQVTILKRPSRLLPNAWHFGGGIEWALPWNFKPLSPDINIGIRGEALIYRRSFEINFNAPVFNSSGVLIGDASVISELTTRYMFNLAAVLAF